MLKLLKKLFNKPEVLPPTLTPRAAESSEPAIALPGVETAALSLAAIIERFPDPLKENVARMPAEDITVVLPVATIIKQLPGGSVKMSLASIYRQAPEGTFGVTRLEEKRMVEVPLAEIFKRVRPELLKRREDQRSNELAETGVDVFGDKAHPYAVSPAVAASNVEPAPDMPVEVPSNLLMETQPQRVLKMSVPMIPAPPPGITAAAAPAKAEPPRASQTGSEGSRVSPPPSVAAAAAAVEMASVRAGQAHANEPPLELLLSDLAVCWPDEVRKETAKFDGAAVTLPSGDVAAGLARGKVAFTWSQLRRWTNAEPSSPEQIDPALELQLPLRVVAPAFLKSQKETNHRKKLTIDESIPALFVPSAQTGGEDATLTIPKLDKAAEELSPPATLSLNGSPVAEAGRPGMHLETKVESVASAAPKLPEPIHVAAAPAPEERRSPALTMGQLFGKAEKREWSPAEIVQHVIKLPQVAGAVVALQEGLVVAHELPEPMKGEVVAAFLPQMYARLNQYADEMKLGEVNEVLLSTNGAQLQLFRLGYVFFAVLGEVGATLPGREMRLIADELARQTDK